ncbi:acetolactate synthase AlsS [Dactylosporangium cerinum]|uniref:Acetolactate synthase AlsS n=2 Tax=Dactylosporangium cerinum TaxID=1434730 RepID=A0ABV9W2D2_9ACTN
MMGATVRVPVRSADRVVEAVRAAGVRYVFGVPGAKIDAVFDALTDSGLELVVCRHEQNAAFMAAAMGRLTGVPGVVLVTSGPGTANLTTALVTANTEQDPVVALCGAVNRADRLKRTHQSMDAAALLTTVTKFTGEVDHPDDVLETVVNAFRAAATAPCGSAAVVLPMDVLAETTSSGPIKAMTPASLGAAPHQEVQRALQIIRSAQRPALLVGARGADPDSCAAIRRLVSDTALPVIETFQGAGVVSHDLEDHYVGRVGLFRNQPGDVILARADVVITVGFDQVEYDPALWNAGTDRPIIHVDTVPAGIDTAYQPAVELRGDVAATLTDMAKSLSGMQVADAFRTEIAGQRRALAAIDDAARAGAHTARGLNPAALVLRLRELLDDNATVACDVGSNYIYMARHFRVYEPRHLLFSNGQQTLGVGMPWAMAASLVRPGTQVVSVSGDGGFLFSAQELETATRLGLTFTHVIMRDNSYDMVGFQEELKYGRRSGVVLGDYDIVRYAGAFGARGYRVSTEQEFTTALRQALDEGGPSIIDVPVDYSNNTGLAAELHADLFE